MLKMRQAPRRLEKYKEEQEERVAVRRDACMKEL
jgi:hypothetical protein